MDKKIEDLKVFTKAHAFVLAIYKVTKKFPKDEQYALINQDLLVMGEEVGKMLSGLIKYLKLDVRS